MVISRVGTQYLLIFGAMVEFDKYSCTRLKIKSKQESDDEACPGDGDQESGDVSERE